MVCKACGRSIVNESANYCEYCGTSFRDNIPLRQEEYTVARDQNRVETEVQNEESEKIITFGNWMGTMLIPFIPFIGIFLYPVMLLVWAFGSDTPKSKKSWARASLLIGFITIVLIIFMLTSVMMEFMNSGMDLESYMNQLYK